MKLVLWGKKQPVCFIPVGKRFRLEKLLSLKRSERVKYNGRKLTEKVTSTTERVESGSEKIKTQEEK